MTDPRPPRPPLPPPGVAADAAAHGPDAPGSGLRQASQRKGSFLHTLTAIAWSFFGVRKGSAYERDVSNLNPVHVIIAGLLAGVVFVLALVLLAKWMVASAAAG